MDKMANKDYNLVAQNPKSTVESYTKKCLQPNYRKIVGVLR